MEFFVVLRATYTTGSRHRLGNWQGDFNWPCLTDGKSEARLFPIEVSGPETDLLPSAIRQAADLSVRHHVYLRTAHPDDIVSYGGMKVVLLSEDLHEVWRYQFEGGKDSSLVVRVAVCVGSWVASINRKNLC